MRKGSLILDGEAEQKHELDSENKCITNQRYSSLFRWICVYMQVTIRNEKETLKNRNTDHVIIITRCLHVTTSHHTRSDVSK